MLDFIVERFEGTRNSHTVLMTNVKVYYSEAISTDDGFVRVASQVVRLGEEYIGDVDPTLLDTREEVLLDLSSLQPHTVLQITRELFGQVTF